MGELDQDSNVTASLHPPVRPLDDRLLVKWLESQPEGLQAKIFEEKLEELLSKAAQPRHVSGNACIKLCYFVEQCRGSRSSLLRDAASSKRTCLSLFGFFIEWNEKNQHRSMRQVIELLSSLIDKNPEQQTKIAIKASILERSMAIITRQAAQPLVKPAFKALECFLSKRTISTEELIEAYRPSHPAANPLDTLEVTDVDFQWDLLFSEVFEWMTFADISPSAGKFLVTAFRELRNRSGMASSMTYTASWQRWIREGLSNQPETLENVKNYLFPPLFKLDRSGSLHFLEDLNRQASVWEMKNQEVDTQSLLRLAAFETGKKSGLIEEPSTIIFQQRSQKKSPPTILLEEEALSPLLVHASDTVRSLAFSVLVSSSSSIRPFSETAMHILQSSMSIFYCDSDAKFRNEVLSNTKHMLERLRGATAFLIREIESISFQVRPEHAISPQERQAAVQALRQTTELLQRHGEFIEWYIDFLLGELIPTSSYQRHITALKAVLLLLRSGILRPSAGSQPPRISDNCTVWPCTIDFFNPLSMRLLLDLLMDPFEDVRSTAASILRLASTEDFTVDGLNRPRQDCQGTCTPDSIEDLPDVTRNPSVARSSFSREIQPLQVKTENGLGLLRDFVQQAEALSRKTGRADYADGVARSTSLLFSLLPSLHEKTDFLSQRVDDLEAKLSLAEKDLGQAVLEAPVHGDFAALSFVWDSISHKEIFCVDPSEELIGARTFWDNFQVRIVLACVRIWKIVKDILCNDSPEGHLPQDLDESDTIDTKDVLSYSFRAVHESSNLLQTILDKIRVRWEGSLSPPPLEIFASIGNLTFLQLSTLRHRGAFSTVSLTFTKCCILTQFEPQLSSASSERLETWYKASLRCIYEQPSTTRRSAGLPALFTAIMSAQATVPSFDRVMGELMTLAGQPPESIETDDINVFQVHALNCIKEIFKSTTLGQRSERYIAKGLELAVESMKSPKWAIRNSGLILFRSTVDRIFGTSESKVALESGWDGKSVKINYDAYPTMATLLENLLEVQPTASEKLGQPALAVVDLVLPALSIISYAGPPPSKREGIFKSVMSHLGSRHWHVREQAAKAICIMMLSMEWKDSIIALLETPTKSANLRHGLLMAAKAILERRLALDPATSLAEVFELIPRLQKLSSSDADAFASPIITTGHIELSIAIADGLVSYEAPKTEEREHLDRTKAIWSTNSSTSPPRMKEYLHWFHPNYVEDKMNFEHCYSALARLAVYQMALSRNHQTLGGFLSKLSRYGTDVQISALECVSRAWKHTGTFPELCKAQNVQIYSNYAAVRTATYTNLTEILENPHRTSPLDDKETVRALQNMLPIYSNCAFEEQVKFGEHELCARIRIGAWLFAAASRTNKMEIAVFEKENFKFWTHWILWGSISSSSVDLRLAVASGLQSLFGNINRSPGPKWERLLPLLFALYNVLNDDDEDVRIIAAKTVSCILETSLTPPAASEKFVPWLAKNWNASPLFAWTILHRLTRSTDMAKDENPLPNSFISARKQFDLAVQDNDALFAEEEQNLFIDRVKDTKLWSKLVKYIPPKSFATDRFGHKHSKHSIILEFATWVVEATQMLVASFSKDGALGWTSKPHAFEIVFRILRCSNMLLDYHSQNTAKLSSARPDEQKELHLAMEGIRSALRKFGEQVINKNIHPELIRELNPKYLPKPVSSSGPNKISLAWKRRTGFEQLNSSDDLGLFERRHSEERPSIATPLTTATSTVSHDGCEEAEEQVPFSLV